METSTISVNTILAVSSLVISALTICTVIYTSATRMAKLEVKVETLWAFLMRRGAAEAINANLATMDSPLMFNEYALSHLNPLKSRLRQLAAANPYDSSLELLFKIEKFFGAELLMDFCLPLKVYYGACNLAALQVATGSPIDPVIDI